MSKKCLTALLITAMLFVLTGCQDASTPKDSFEPEALSAELQYEGEMELKYAQEFRVDLYKGGYSLISISDGSRFLVVPEGKKIPSDLQDNITALQQPIDNIYLAASAAMDMFVSVDAVDRLRFSSQKEESWFIPEAKQAMKAGELIYAGKYSAPDYELIISGDCDLAFENTMIFHTPEVREQLQKFGIPVLVDHSSYENTPQGRMEWVKLAGILAGKTEEAEAVFDEQVREIESVAGEEKTGKTVAFFYITSNGSVNIRKSSDYIPKMIKLAGGEYIFDDIGDKDDTASSSMNMQMESFYAKAKDADFLIYNSAIEGEVSELDNFIEKSPLLKNFKAVKEGHVYCTTENLYQSSMELGSIIRDIHCMMTGQEEEMKYIFRLE